MNYPQKIILNRWQFEQPNTYIKELHRRYLLGEFSLRGMAKRLDVSYRELYAILEELELPLTRAPEKTAERIENVQRRIASISEN